MPDTSSAVLIMQSMNAALHQCDNLLHRCSSIHQYDCTRCQVTYQESCAHAKSITLGVDRQALLALLPSFAKSCNAGTLL